MSESAWQGRKLLRAGRSGTLATTAQGQPFASLVTPATAPDLSVLMLLSELSEHTRHLHADPRCAIMVVAAPEETNPQTAPRVTVTGLAELVEPDEALRARYLALHPYATLYAGFADFHLWRVRPQGGLFVGGFGKAARLRTADLTPDPASAAAIAAAEAGICAHMNADHADALSAIVGQDGEWRMVALDVDGCDVAQGERVIRVPWSAPVSTTEAVRRELTALAEASTG